jgi:hypothetical protein
MVDPDPSEDNMKAHSLVTLAGGARGQTFWPPVKESANVFFGPHSLAPGLLLMSGITGSGKSTNSLALALMIATTSRQPVSYVYTTEPRADYPASQDLLGMNAPERINDLLQATAGSSAKSVVIDSLTHVIPLLGLRRLGDSQDTTMKEGLRRSDVLGTLDLDLRARAAGLTVIATVNAELFPRPDALEGACEGFFVITGMGALTLRERLTRSEISVVIPPPFLNAARTLLGYRSAAKTTKDWQSTAL